MDEAERLLMPFFNSEGLEIPSLSTDQMREVDRIAVEDFHLSLLQMMENAGRNLAEVVMSKFEDLQDPVLLLAGSGGNGGGGLAAARHLHNHGFQVKLILAKPKLGQAVQNQLTILRHAGILPLGEEETISAFQDAGLIIDALIGYSLHGAPRGRTAELIQLTNKFAEQVLSLDIPSGMDATTGESPGEAIHPSLTVTLALPKSGLTDIEGDIILTDIGIPPEVYNSLGIHIEPFFREKYWIPINKKNQPSKERSFRR
jgi:NAD(P)H-hydrate epimerase